MTVTIDQLRSLMDEEGLRYYLDPQRDAVMLNAAGANGRFQFVFSIQSDGEFLQMRTIRLLECPKDHPHIAVVLQTLAEINYVVRLVKFSWDSNDGEIVAYADTWLMDNPLTQTLLHRILANYFPSVDEQFARIKAAIEMGKDPGEHDPQELVKQLEKEGGLPEAVQTELDKIRGDSDPPADGSTPNIEEI